MLHILGQFSPLLLQGFLTTLRLLGGTMLLGVPVGMFFGVLGARHSASVAAVIKGARFVTKVVPILVLLFWLHYPLQSMLGIVANPFLTAVVALGTVNAIAIADILLTELKLLPDVYREAGQTLGLSGWQIIRHIELPLLLRRIVPQLLLIQAAMLEYTLLASLISVPELFRVVQTINAMVYQPVAMYSLLAVFFLLILGPFHLLISWFQRRYVAVYS